MFHNASYGLPVEMRPEGFGRRKDMAKIKRVEPPIKKSIWAAQKNRTVLRWIIEIGIALLLAFVCVSAFGQTITIQESSMNPTIQAGDKVLINKAAYMFGSIKRGDVIIYKSSDSADAAYHVKRVIGLPGEKVQIKDGLILINGTTYMEDVDLPSINEGGLAASGVTVGTNEYFVLGDNRNSSEDSRYADVGNISKDNIKGKVWFIHSPKDRRGIVR